MIVRSWRVLSAKIISPVSRTDSLGIQLDTLINNAGIMRNLKLAGDRALEGVTREVDIKRSRREAERS